MKRIRSVFGSPKSPLGARHCPSGLNTLRLDDSIPFVDYVVRTRDMLHLAHAKLDSDARQKIVDGNAPFALLPAHGYTSGIQKPYKRGVLLTHGLTGSPYFMRSLAAFFQEQGFRVLVLLLPGHGTQPGDLLNIRWQEWQHTLAYGVDRLAEEVDEIYLAGYSVGGTLSVYQALSDSRVRGLFLFSPAFEIAPRAALANLHKLFSWLIPAAKWVEIMPDLDIYKYESFPKNAAAQMYGLTVMLRVLQQRHQLNIPTFSVASENDTTVSTSATLAFMAQAQHPLQHTVLYTTHPEQFPPGIAEQQIELVNSVVPEQNILSSSHMAIVVPEDDPHYGAQGAYSNCIHYYPDEMEKYSACIKNPNSNLQGEITEKNLNLGIMRRLSYNPKFAQLKDSMRRFIEQLP